MTTISLNDLNLKKKCDTPAEMDLVGVDGKETGVKLMQLAVRKCRRLIIKCPTHPDGRIGVEIAMRFARQPLRAADQDVCAIKLKQIRALPHKAKLLAQLNARRIAPDP